MEAAMNDTILALCQRLQDIGWATALRESQFMFPIVEGIHLLGLAFILGPVLMLDFRLAGVAWRDLPVSKVAKTFVPYSIGGAVVMFVTGLLLFCAEAVRCWNSGWFKIKLVALAVAGANALYFHTKTQSTWSQWDTLAVPPAEARRAGWLSIVLWTAVVFAGRWTAYNL
ncbi:MAG: hypothetical protein RL328_2613 [Acidobacteriota bacterium]|jgi:hypothetical protein